MELNIDSAVSQLTTIRDWLRWCTSRFYEGQITVGHGNQSYWDEAVFLVFQALYLPPVAEQQILGARLTMPERYKVAEWVRRRVVEREPVAYIANTAWQHGIAFYVDQRVLIPRSPIGQLLYDGLSPFIAQEPSTILDMCTGSGCLAVLAALAFPEAMVDCVDISADALAVASVNIEQHAVGDRVQVMHSDGLAQMKQDVKYDLILCNPPYVDAQEMTNLPEEYCFEPALALASGQDGLDFTRLFLSLIGHFMNENAVLALEVGHSWQALEAYYPDFAFTWLDIEGGAVGVSVLTQADCMHFAQTTPSIA